MRQGGKPRKSKDGTRRSVGRKSPKNDALGRRELEKRLAESLEREGAKDRALTEALEQQTATSEILRVISRSQTDVQPVFDTIVQSAVRLCDAIGGNLQTFDGERMHLVAHPNWPSEAVERMRGLFPRQPDHSRPAGRAVLNRAVVNTPDVFEDPDYASEILDNARVVGWRSALSVPMFREGKPIGVISIVRASVGLFSDKHVDLLKTFADQAVIAIENVRLFNEAKEALEQQTATSEILRVISSSPTDVQPVFDVIAQNVVGLCDGYFSLVGVSDGERVHLRATYNLPDEWAKVARTVYPLPLRSGPGTAQVIREQRVLHILDSQEDPAVSALGRERARLAGYHTWLGVPMLGPSGGIGVIAVARREKVAFTDKQIALLQTFADQAVIAIENVRLFKELEAANRELSAASQHKSEFLANMSHELRTPLNAVIGFSEVLSEGMFGEINDKQAEYLRDILESGRHLLSLINDILDLSKIEAGRMELEAADFDLPSAIDNALILVRERATRRGITLGRTIDERLGTVRGDERKVKQVLLNLLSNALKFTPEGGRIDVRAGVNNGVAEIAVADTGVGIAPEDQEAVFEEFRQVGTADKKVEGTGLGLALSRKFIELHGGRIWVTSQLGAGSTFTFTLPLRR